VRIPKANTVYQKISGLLPARVAARVDLCRPSYRVSWGGPLNGQLRRREVVRDIAGSIRFDRVLETGTYRGSSTEFFASVFGVPVHTVEADRRNFEYSRHRLRVEPLIDTHFGDSRTFLREMARVTGCDTVFIYLDAHWEKDLPLREELEIVSQAWASCVVMIDDFQVPDDPGYRFDDYGDGQALTPRYLPAAVANWNLYYPSAPSHDETGARRGSCVLSPPSLLVKSPGLMRPRAAHIPAC